MYKSLHMAGLEPQKGKPPSADAIKKTLILDEQIRDKMDISFHPGPKSKKKVFDSEKLDMDFELDGDLSSFKMDMPDFDLSSFPRIDAKTKEVDMSDLDSSNSPKKASKVDLAEGNSTLDGELETSGNFKLPPGPRCQEKIMTTSMEESDQQSHLPEKAMSAEPYARQTTHDFPGDLVGGVDSNGDDVSNRRNVGCPQITKVNTILSGKEDVNDKMLIGDGPNHQPSTFKNASSLDIGSSGSCNGDRSMSDTDILAENDESATGDSDIGKTSATLVSRKTPQDILSIKGNQHSNLKLPLSTEASESTAEKFTLRNARRAGEFYSKISKILEDTGPQLNQPPLIGAPFLSFGNNTKFVTTHLRPAMEKGEGSDSDGVPNRTKLLGNSQLCDKEGTYMEPVIGSEQRKSFKDLWNIGGNKVSLNAAPPKQVKSWRSSEQNKELQGNVEMKTAEIVDGREKMTQNFPLKQKKIEGLNPGLASLMLLKHLSLSREAGLSQNTCRNFKEPPKGAVEQEACPNLIQRFKELEENVEMDVFNRFTKLLQQSGNVTNGQICISAQSYENFDLNSSLTARENNPKNDQKSSKEVASDRAGPKGTTVIAVVCKRRILIASDGRLSSAEEDSKGLILTGFGQKILKISRHIFASISGDVSACEHMFNTVRNAVLRSSNDLTMSVVEEECKNYMNSWKCQFPDDEFPGTVLIYGYSEGHASIYSAGTGEQIESHRGAVVGSGSGFGKAKEYLVEQLEKQRRRNKGEPTEKEYRKMMKTAVAVAALQDRESGGFACFAAVRKGKKGKYYEKRDHMLRILKKNYDEVQTYLSKAFMLVSHDMAYSLSMELPFNRLIERVFDRVESAHIISVAKNPKITVRVILFEHADARSSSNVHPGNNITTFSREDGVKVELFVPTRDLIARLCEDLTAGVRDF